MRRQLAAAAAFLVVVVPAANASSISVQAIRPSPTQVYLYMNTLVKSSGSGHEFVDYGTTTSYGASFDLGTGNSTFAAVYQGLVPGTTYHFRARLEEPTVPMTTLGPDMVFSTPPLGGVFLNLPAETFASPDTKMLTGIMPIYFPDQLCSDTAPPGAGFDPSTRYRAFTVTNPSAAGGCVTVQVVAPCVNVHVSAYSGAFAGVAYDPALAAGNGSGADLREFQVPVAAGDTFTIVVADDGSCGSAFAVRAYNTGVASPNTTSAAAAVVGVRSATLRGTASAHLVHGMQVRFEWGRTTAYGNVLPESGLPVDNADHLITRRLTDLTPNVVYHARLVSFGPGGTTFGADIAFTTLTAQPALRLAGARIAVGGSSSVGVRVVCPLTTTVCTGKVVLRRVNAKHTSLGSKTFSIAGGRTATVRVRLATASRRLVKRVGVLKITATLTARDGDSEAFRAARRSARLVWHG